MSKELYIGIDSGTQGTKAVVFDSATGNTVAASYALHELIEGDRGRKEQQPEWWISACRKVLTKVLSSPEAPPKDVKGIGVSGQQHGLVVLDKEGKVIRPAKLWCDTETEEQCQRLTEAIGGEKSAHDKLGNPIAVGYTASKILWLAEHEPDNFRRIHTVLLPHDYINFWLTGEKKAEYGDASGTAFFDIRKREWSAEVLNAIDPDGRLHNCLPELIQSHEPVGIIRPELAEEFGFNTKLIVSSGGGDNMMAAIGTGNVRDGIITTSLGTSGAIYTCSSTPITDNQGELAAFCSSTGSWLPLVCTMNVTVSTELTRDLLSLSLPELNQLVSSARIGAEGIMLIPYFNGERTPAFPLATASYTGLTGANFNRANLCRAAMEGPTYGLRYGLEVLQRNGIVADEIRLIGGGAKSAIWRQMVADIFNCRVLCPVAEEAGALGAALQALWCHSHTIGTNLSIQEITDRYIQLDESKSVDPIVENAEKYETLFRDYLRISQLSATYSTRGRI